MSLDAVRALKEGFDRVASRNGALFAALFALISLLGNVALDSATIALGALTAELAAETGQPQPETLPEGATPLAFDLPGAVIALLVVIWLLAWAATSVVAVRTMASDRAGGDPGDPLTRRVALASANELLARVVVLTLVSVGFLLLVLPGIFLAICFYFVRPLIAVEDRNAIDAMTESWRLSRGNRLTILALLISAVVVYAAISIAGSLGALALSAVPAAGLAVSIAFAAVANVFWLAVSARAFVQFREQSEEPEPDDPGPDDEWDDPPGVEW